jgi:hypothetical protein
MSAMPLSSSTALIALAQDLLHVQLAATVVVVALLLRLRPSRRRGRRRRGRRRCVLGIVVMLRLLWSRL